MKTVYFCDKNRTRRYVALGQMVSMIHSCYIKAKELEYDRIIFEWHDMVAYPYWTSDNTYGGLLGCPGKGILPITFVPKGSSVIKSADVIDISQSDILYDGSPPIISNPMNQGPHTSYLNYYYEKYGKRPTIDIDKSTEKPYILFHYRESTQKRQLIRNTPYQEFKKLFRIIKDNDDEHDELRKIGEPSMLDSDFDVSYDYLASVQELFKIINNASLLICSPSSMLQMAYMFGVPAIILSNKSYDKGMWDKWGSESYMKGKSSYDWIDWDRYYHIRHDKYKEMMKVENILKYIGKVLKR